MRMRPSVDSMPGVSASVAFALPAHSLIDSRVHSAPAALIELLVQFQAQMARLVHWLQLLVAPPNLERDRRVKIL